MHSKTRKLTLLVFFILCSLSSIIFCLWFFKEDLGIKSISSDTVTAHTPQPERYSKLKKDLEIRRVRLSERYTTARNKAQQDAVLTESRELLETALPELMRCWLGTQWDFNGITEQPGDGKIACGYFVSTVLRDAGFNLHRIRLAQQPSQTILGAFVPNSARHIHAGMEYSSFHKKVHQLGKGIYIVGLDKHVGFIVHDGMELYFIHSSGINPHCVVEETKDKAILLKNSNYRVIGNVTAQKDTLISWLSNEQVYP